MHMQRHVELCERTPKIWVPPLFLSLSLSLPINVDPRLNNSGKKKISLNGSGLWVRSPHGNIA